MIGENMSNTLKSCFVDYLFQLRDGEIPDVIKPMILRREGSYIYWDNGQMRGCLQLGEPPYGANMPLLGFALFGMFWTKILGNIDKMIKKRMKKEQELKPRRGGR